MRLSPLHAMGLLRSNHPSPSQWRGVGGEVPTAPPAAAPLRRRRSLRAAAPEEPPAECDRWWGRSLEERWARNWPWPEPESIRFEGKPLQGGAAECFQFPSAGE